MTENLEFRVSVHLANPSWFVAQKSEPEMSLRAAPAGGDEKQVFIDGSAPRPSLRPGPSPRWLRASSWGPSVTPRPARWGNGPASRLGLQGFGGRRSNRWC